MLEARLREALQLAGEQLAAGLSQRLAQMGLAEKISVVVERGRVTVGSHSLDVRDLEVGTPGVPPVGVLERTARDLMPDILETIRTKCHGALG